MWLSPTTGFCVIPQALSRIAASPPANTSFARDMVGRVEDYLLGLPSARAHVRGAGWPAAEAGDDRCGAAGGHGDAGARRCQAGLGDARRVGPVAGTAAR